MCSFHLRWWFLCSKKRGTGRFIEQGVSFSATRHQQQREANATNLSVYIDELGRREEQSSFYSTHLGISVSNYISLSVLYCHDNNRLAMIGFIVGYFFQVMDRKWEIPRKWLVIDQMPLGEGEFGQVLRATVTSVTGILGKQQFNN